MAEMKQLVVFAIDEDQYALNLYSVERIVRAVEIARVPDSSPFVLGVINVEGRVIPVLNTRKRLRLPEREIELSDLFIIVRANNRSYALVADEVMPVVEVSEQQLVSSENVLNTDGFVQSVAKMDSGMIMILSEEKTLTSEDGDTITLLSQTINAIDDMNEESTGGGRIAGSLEQS